MTIAVDLGRKATKQTKQIITRDFPTILKLGRGPVEFGEKAFGPSKLGRIDTEPPFQID